MAKKSWSVSASSIANNSRNRIRDVVENLDLEPNPDKPMIALSLGDPTVFGNLAPPQIVIDAIKESAESNRFNGYFMSAGHPEAREAVARYSSSEKVQVRPEDVILCSGCSCAIDLCVTVLANPGENILVPRPGFPLYKTLAEGLGIKTKSYDLIPEKGWQVDLEHMESMIDEDTRAMVVISPSNPCGSVYSEEHLRDVLDIARRHCLPIIADEIYEHMVYPSEEFVPIASLTDEVPILSCSGITKRFLVPGWRMGWIIIHDRNDIFKQEVKQGLIKLSQRIMGSSTLIQGALPKILSETPESFYADTLVLLQRHARLAFSHLSRIPGLHPIMPQGAMYMMVGIDIKRFPEYSSSLDLLKDMVREESVFCLPGECFDCPNYFRIVLTVPEEMLVEACIRIGSFFEKYYVASNNLSIGDYITFKKHNLFEQIIVENNQA